MIVSNICGGLGNQMFQYAIGRRLSLKKGEPLVLDVSYYQNQTRETPHPLLLRYLSVNGEFTFDWQNTLIRNTVPGEEAVVKGIKETANAYDPSIIECPDKNIYLHGYWQTENYFSPIADIIRADFSLPEPMTASRAATAALMSDCEAISMHVRRGDYVTDPKVNAFHGTCSIEWYERAIAIMREELKAPRFFIFSDDPDWAKDNLPKDSSNVFVDPQPDGRSHEDMLLMSKCKHHITANSSFSWWGAWLNPSPNKKVIAPKRWVLAENDQQDRVPPSWRTL